MQLKKKLFPVPPPPPHNLDCGCNDCANCSERSERSVPGKSSMSQRCNSSAISISLSYSHTTAQRSIFHSCVLISASSVSLMSSLPSFLLKPPPSPTQLQLKSVRAEHKEAVLTRECMVSTFFIQNIQIIQVKVAIFCIFERKQCPSGVTAQDLQAKSLHIPRSSWWL